MKKFNFRLEPVLTIRQSKEEEIQILLAAAQDRLQLAMEEMSRTHQQRLSIARQLEEFKRRPVGVEDLIIYQGYLETLDQRLVTQECNVRELERAVEQVREQLLQASKEKKAIEKIKERQQSEYNFEFLRQECNFLDDIGTIRCARKKMDEIRNAYQRTA